MPRPDARFTISATDQTRLAVAGAEANLQRLESRLIAVGAAAGAAGLASGLGFAVKTTADFQAAVQDLSAITGATGDDLTWLSDKAREFGATTTLSATEAAEAFKLVASAKPDLLENAEALARVTRETITLSEASGTDLATSARTLGIALNQFGAGADQAGRFINVLAAGAKFGASEIAETAQALEKAGVSAAGAKVSFEETNAAIQTLARAGIKTEEAGTALRNIFINLQTQTDDKFNPAIVGLVTAFENLKAANLTTAEASLLFGKRAFDAGQTLIGNVGVLDAYVGKLTGTSVAYEQAKVKLDQLWGDVKALNSAFEEQQIVLGSKLTPKLRDLTQAATDLLRDEDRLKDVLLTTASAMGALGAQAVLTKTGLISLATGATTANAAMLSLKATTIALATRLAPLAFLMVTIHGVTTTYAESQERAARASKLFGDVIEPNRVALEKLGIAVDKIDPTNINEVMQAIRNAYSQGLDLGVPVLTGTEYDQLNEQLQGAKDGLLSIQRLIGDAAGQGQDLTALTNIYAEQVGLIRDLKTELGEVPNRLEKVAAAAAETKDKMDNAVGKTKTPDKSPAGLTDAQQGKLDALRESLLTEEEAVRASHEKRLGIIAESLEREKDPTARAELLNLRIKEATDFQSKLSAIETAGLTERQKFEALSLKGKAANIFGTLESITAGVATHSKKLFQLNKIAGIGNAVIATYEGITKALAAYPPPLSFAMAAAQGAAGFAQVQAIRSTSFGGGGSGTTPSFAGSVPTVNSQPVGPGIRGVESGGGQTVTITINAVDTEGAVAVIEKNRGMIQRVVQDAYDDRGKTGGPLG